MNSNTSKLPWQISETSLNRIRDEGYFIASLDAEVVQKINNELSQWRNVPAINGYGALHHAGDALLQNVALYSPVSLRVAVSDDILDFFESVFGEQPILSKIEYRRALQIKPEMSLHCDPGSDISIFVYLNGVAPETGSTFVIPGTSKIGVSLNEGSLQVPLKAEEKIGHQRIIPIGPAGTSLFLGSKTWHGRTPTEKVGREILWLSYVPLSRLEEAVNLVVSSNALIGLSERQMKALGLGVQLRRNAEDFRLSRELDTNSLSLLPAGYIRRIALRNSLLSAYRMLPSSLRTLTKRAFSILSRSQDAYKPAP